MRKITLLLLVIATASLTGAVAKGKKCEAQKAKYVVLIGSDGFSSVVERRQLGLDADGSRAGTARLYDMGQSGSRPAVARDR